MIFLIAFFAGLAQIFFGVILSREVRTWPRLSFVKRSFLLLAIWLVPVVGAVIAYKAVKLDWFRKTTSSGSVPVSIFGEVDAALTPALDTLWKRDKKFVSSKEKALSLMAIKQTLERVKQLLLVSCV